MLIPTIFLLHDLDDRFIPGQHAWQLPEPFIPITSAAITGMPAGKVYSTM